jgi:hypothetical protein
MPTDPDLIELSIDQKRRIAEVADRAGRPWPEVLADALQIYRRGRERSNGAIESLSLTEALRRDGLLGCIKNAPSDLSTNPKYMEDFGSDSDR